MILYLRHPDLEVRQPVDEMAQYNYAKANWDEMANMLCTNLAKIPLGPELNSPSKLDQFTASTIAAAQNAIEQTTPRKQPSPFSKSWWTDELTQLRKEQNRLRNRYRRKRSVVDKKKWKEAKRICQKEVRAAKQKAWREFAEAADNITIWQLKKYISTLPSQPYIPTLDEGKAASNQQKAEALQRIFFPPPPAADLTDISNPATQYPREVSVSTQITMQQIERAINKLAPNKAPGPDDISNAVLKRNAHLLMPYIQKIAQASLDINHFPAPFKNTITIVLRKPSKPDYTKPNSYRPIALENTIGKVIESIITDMIVYLTEEHSLLLLHHFGGSHAVQQKML